MDLQGRRITPQVKGFQNQLPAQSEATLKSREKVDRNEYQEQLERGPGTLYRKGRAKKASYDGHDITNFEAHPLGLHINGQPQKELSALRSQGRIQQI